MNFPHTCKFYTVQDATLSNTDYAENARFFTVLLFYKINKYISIYFNTQPAEIQHY